jgi:excisionase family DNA binding protein
VDDAQKESIVAAVVERLTPELRALREAHSKPEKFYFNVEEAADFIGCSKQHIYRLKNSGILPASNIGSNDGPDFRFARADLVAYMEERKAGAKPPLRRKKGASPLPLPLSRHRRQSKGAVVPAA